MNQAPLSREMDPCDRTLGRRRGVPLLSPEPRVKYMYSILGEEPSQEVQLPPAEVIPPIIMLDILSGV